MKNNQLFHSKTLIWWLFACALTPVLWHIWGESWVSSFGKKYAYAELLNTLMVYGLFVIPFLIATLNYIPFRRIAKNAFYGQWLGIGFVTVILVNVAWGYGDSLVAKSFLHFKSDSDWGAAFSWLDVVFTSHWLVLAIVALVSATSYSLVAYVLLEKVTGYKWWFFVLSAFLATLLCLIIAQSLDLLGFNTWYDNYNRWSLSVKSWSNRWFILLEQGLSGAVWGWLSYTFLCLLVRKQSTSDTKLLNYKSVLICGLFLIICLSATHVKLYPYLLKKLSNHLELAVSQSPKQDLSSGKNILMFANEAQISPPSLPQYPVVYFAPDSQSFVMLDNQRAIHRIEISSGKNLGQIGTPLGKYDRYERAWSANGRYFALRTTAESVTVGRGYTKHRSKIQLYDGVSYQLLSDYIHRVDECFEAYGSSIAFEGDTAIWLTCEHEYTQQKPDNVMAIKLALPNLTVLEVLRYGEYAPHHAVDGMASDSGHVYVWQDHLIGDNKHILLHDLTAKTKPLVLPDLTQKHLAGSLTQQFESIENGVFMIPFCGNDNQVSDPQVKEGIHKKLHGFCRTLGVDLKSGQIVLKQDKVKPDSMTIVNEAVSKQDSLLFKSSHTDHSRQGTVMVLSLDSVKVMQSIQTTSQNILGISPDNQWLVMYALYDGKIRIYRVNH